MSPENAGRPRIASPQPTRVLVSLEGNAVTTQRRLTASVTQEMVKDKEMPAPTEGDMTNPKSGNDLSKTTTKEEEATRE